MINGFCLNKNVQEQEEDAKLQWSTTHAMMLKLAWDFHTQKNTS